MSSLWQRLGALVTGKVKQLWTRLRPNSQRVAANLSSKTGPKPEEAKPTLDEIRAYLAKLRVTSWRRARFLASHAYGVNPLPLRTPTEQEINEVTSHLHVPEPTANETLKLAHHYELQRMEHDKWVTPGGDPPPPPKPKKPRTPRKPKPAPVIDVDGEEHHHIDEEEDDAAHPKAMPIPAIDGFLVPDYLVIDEHHEGGKVLYHQSEFWGEFSFRDSILEQLERYFFYLRRMRRYDPDAYGFYRQVGANIMPYSSTGAWDPSRKPGDDHQLKFTEAEIAGLHRQLPAHFNTTRPGFGCVAFGTNTLSEAREMQAPPKGRPNMRLWVPKFMYYSKYDKPPADWEQMPRDGDVYALTIWWDKPQDKEIHMKWGIPQEYGIWVSKDGLSLKALKKKKKWNRWEIPYDLKRWAHDVGVNVQTYLCHLFIEAALACEDTDLSMIRVNVHKGSLTAVFGVNSQRLAYFFRDRDIKVNHKGKVERMFCIVKPYQKKDGTYVKMHPRGLREFDWAGYHVQLTVPGLHHWELQSFPGGAHHLGKKKPDKDAINQTEFGEAMADYVRTGKLTKLEERAARSKEKH